MNSRAATNGSHILFFRFPSVAAILISGMAAIFLLWMPQHSIHAALRKDQQVGDALFHRKGCVRCHVADAAGTAKGPDLRTIGKLWNKTQIERQIVEGGYEMPPLQDALQQDEVKHWSHTLVHNASFLRTNKQPDDLLLTHLVRTFRSLIGLT